MDENKSENLTDIDDFKGNRKFAGPRRNVSANNLSSQASSQPQEQNNSTSGSEINSKSLLIGVGVGVLVCLACFFAFRSNDSRKAPDSNNKTTSNATVSSKPIDNTAKAPQQIQKTEVNQASSVGNNGIYRIEGDNVLLYNQNLVKHPGGPFPQYVYLRKTANPNFYSYFNNRFGFIIRVPANMTIATTPTNGDGATFSRIDGKYTMSVSGGFRLNRTLDDFYRSFDGAIANGTTDNPYSAKGQTWFVRTWGDKNGISHYVKYFIGDSKVCSFHFTYPSFEFRESSPIIGEIEKDFRTNWNNK